MKRYIALFRGINVGGRNKLPMKELVKLLEVLDLENIKTYIQSGNVVFNSEIEDRPKLTNKIGAAIKQQFGFKPKILLLESSELEKAIEANPFPVTEPKALHFGFLASKPANPDVKALEKLRKESEQFQLIDKVFYLYAPEGVGRSKLAAKAEKLLDTDMTDRNWRTVSKIREMIGKC
jgi:uncharacterized protein (DUF1697 family)